MAMAGGPEPADIPFLKQLVASGELGLNFEDFHFVSFGSHACQSRPGSPTMYSHIFLYVRKELKNN